MNFLVYSLIAMPVLFLSYRISLSRILIFTALAGIFILIRDISEFPYEAIVFVFFINAVPFIAEASRREMDRYKADMRSDFEVVKKSYEDLVSQDKREMESNLEREKRMQQVLSLYEISKDMSGCLSLEDIFSIFSATLKKSFRFSLSKFILLKDSKEMEAVYEIKMGTQTIKAAPDAFDKELVKIVLNTKKTVSICRQDGHEFLRRLSVIKDFETLVAIPLFSEKELAGILYVENMPRRHFENFIILTGQFVIQFQKVSLYKKVQEMSIKDSLTEIGTRRYFLERFSEETRRSMRHKANLSFLMLDLDYFKQKNDKFGHLVGDVVLKEVAAILKASLREIDIIGRYGGEEFAIVLTETGRDGARQVAERIRESIESTIFKAYDEVVSTTVSIGISVFPDDGGDVESLIESADKALYKAKETGRNRVC
ncbi:MAG: GGDEF domain-containing protein [Candidatus Omnitrophica bacterium]|nr:GGDEF domain-containing protein [Candidatus Omnitrophota bacterium]